MIKEKYKYFWIILQSDCLRYIVEFCHSRIAKEKETATGIERGPQEKMTNVICKDCSLKLLSVDSHRYFEKSGTVDTQNSLMSLSS